MNQYKSQRIRDLTNKAYEQDIERVRSFMKEQNITEITNEGINRVLGTLSYPRRGYEVAQRINFRLTKRRGNFILYSL